MSWRREKQWIKFCEKNDPERPTSVHLARRRCASWPAHRPFFSSTELGSLGERAVVPADWVTRCITPVASADELRRYGYQWFVLDIAFGKPKGWAVGRLERMWMAQGYGGGFDTFLHVLAIPKLAGTDPASERRNGLFIPWSKIGGEKALHDCALHKAASCRSSGALEPRSSLAAHVERGHRVLSLLDRCDATGL